MGALKKVFGNWWFLSVTAVVLLALVFGLLLPMVVSQLRPWWVRALVVGLIVAVWAGLAIWRVLSARKRADRLAKSLAQVAPAETGEGQVLAKRMTEALSGLKSASGNKRDYLYSRPWYVIIGPPGAGKTTALLNSGLRFPFSDSSLKGAGGTRNLDFWFADEAVLVDTAGRYTTQDSDAERDKGAWRSFLELLKKNRPLQPINGVLVAIGLDELVGADVTKIDNHAATVRRRLSELQAGLEIQVPVYVVFTKADLVAGFSEFYEDLDVEGRRAVLGATFPWQPGTRLDTAALAGAFDGMAQAVSDRTSKRLQEDLDARRRGLIVGFPAQMAALRSRVVRFLDSAFPETAQETPAPLRGFYFTSGVQQGTPLDKILGGMAAVYDAPVRASSQGRAYFINRLLQDVVIAEAGLVATSPEAKRRRAMAMAAGFAAIGLVSTLLLAAWTVSFFQNRSLQGRLLAGAQNSSQEVRNGGFDLVEVRESDPDLEASLSVLRGLRDLPRGYAERKAGGAPLLMGFGLYQRGLSQAAEQAYREGLQRIMLPRLLLTLERRLQDNAADPIAAYEPLKVYLMLGGQAPSLDRKAVKAWAMADWAETAYPGADREGVRKELGQHLDALLEDEQFGAVWAERRAPLDGALVTASRAAVQSLSLADRAYALLKQKAAASGNADWSAGAVLSGGDGRAFANGDSVLSQTVPYFYTKAGFQEAYQKGLQNVRADLERDLWVMGSDAEKESIRAQIQAVRPGVAALYARDYVKHWEAVVASLQPADYFNDPVAFGAATGAPSPLKVVLLEVRKNTDFGAAKPTAEQQAQAAAMKKAQAAVPGGQAAAKMLATDQGPGVDAGQQITMAFRQVHDFVGTGKAAAPVDEFITKLRTAVTAKGAADRAGGMGGSDAAQASLNQAMSELAASAATAPPLIQGFAAQASQQGDRAQVSSAQGAVSGAYEQVVEPTCRSVTEGRYPFVTASQADAPIGDLIRVFGLNGQVDGFTQQRLRPLLDTAGPVWRWRTDDPIAASLDPTSAGEFQKATQLRDLLLSGAAVKVDATGFGGAVTAAELTAGGGTHRFDAGQVAQRTVQWTTASIPEAKVVLYEGDKVAKEIKFEGPWALFRLFDDARKENAGPNSFKATFGEGASYVTLRVMLPTEDNPFSRGGLWSFRCPPRL